METPLRVLSVEDSEDDAILIMRALRRSGYKPTFERVDTAEAMVAALQEKEWDLVIADYSMPRFSGLGALSLLQQSGRELPFIIVSGNIGEEVAVGAMKAGAHDYVMKDNLARLGPAVRRELHEAEVQRARRRAEESLKESEERYRTLVETSPDAIGMADLDGRLVMANQQAARLYGVDSPSEFLGRSMFELLVPEERERAVSLMVQEMGRSTSLSNLEFTFLRQDGSSFPAELSVSVSPDASGQPREIIFIGRDITERKAAEEAFRRSNREMATLYEATRAISSNLSLDDVLQAVALQMAQALDSGGCAISLWDRERGALETLVDLSFKHPNGGEAPGTMYSLDDFPATRQVLETREPLLLHRGSPTADEPELALMVVWEVETLLMLPLVARDNVLGLVELYNENHVQHFSPAEIRLAQSLASQAAVAIENARLYQETRRQAKRLEALVEIGYHVSATLDLGTVLERIASHARELLAADDSDVYLLQPDGKTLRATVALGEYAEQIKATPITLGEGVVGWVAQHGVAEIINEAEKDPRGKQVPDTPEETHALMCAPLVSRSQVVGVMALARLQSRGGFAQDDLDFLISLSRQAVIAIENARLYATEQQRTEELARALEQQRELDRLRDQFIQNVSHELRTPVAIIQGYSELLEQGELGELSAAQRQPVETIARRAAMLRKLVDDLTAILQTESGEVRLMPVDLGALAHDMVQDYRLEAKEAEVKLRTEIDANLPVVYGDPDHLRRMLDNLLGNAIKFTPVGGTVLVRLRRNTAGLTVEVADTGVGIPADQLERIFDRFYQVDGSMTRRFGGTGLGLALVREIAEAHGGSVKAESEPNKGSLFRVTLPIDL